MRRHASPRPKGHAPKSRTNVLQRGTQRASALRAERRAATVPAPYLQRALYELADAMRALAISRHQAHAALKQIQTLIERNSRLERELVELAGREAQVR